MDLERCVEVMWEKLVLFTLYDIFANLFLKPVVTYSSFRMWTLNALRVSLEGTGIAGICIVCFFTLYSLFEDSLNQVE